MYIRNKYFSLIFKLLIVVIGIFGIYLSLSDSPLVGMFEHLSYYTNLSNLLCIIFFLYYSIKMIINIKENNHNYHNNFKGAVTITILITFIVYNFILRPFMHDVEGVMKINSVGNLIVHVILPLMVLFDYILFDEKGNYSKAYLWVLIPLFYFIFICIRAKFGYTFTYAQSRYPYFFLDIDEYGIYQVIFNAIISILLILALIYIYVFIDKKLSNKKILNH